MKTIDNLIDALGGTTAVADVLSRSPSTVSNWRSRGAIPVEYWEDLIAAGRKIGVKVSADRLMGIHNERAAS